MTEQIDTFYLEKDGTDKCLRQKHQRMVQKSSEMFLKQRKADLKLISVTDRRITAAVNKLRVILIIKIILYVKTFAAD
jgi:hypothetical protein